MSDTRISWRTEYRGEPLDPDGFATDPMVQLAGWLDEARAVGVAEPNAMCLATAGDDRGPDARMVLLKEIDGRGLTLYTNLESPKAEQLALRPRAALVFHWPEQWRQVRVRGDVEPLDDAQARAYFATRPREAQVGAWASRQSRELSSRAQLDAAVAEVEARFAGGEVPKPPLWGGYRVVPDEVEFWEGRAGRLHDRLVYRPAESGWGLHRLAP